ncbi:hypothetical protein Bca4012_002740 [Brassica carinata]
MAPKKNDSKQTIEHDPTDTGQAALLEQSLSSSVALVPVGERPKPILKLGADEVFRSWISSHLLQTLLPGELLLSVKDYCRAFVAKDTNSPEITDAMLKLASMLVLKPKIREVVKMFEPKNLNEI